MHLIRNLYKSFWQTVSDLTENLQEIAYVIDVMWPQDVMFVTPYQYIFDKFLGNGFLCTNM